MIDRDDCTSLSNALGVNLNGWFGEGGIDVVDRNRVVGVGSTTRQLELRI
jgi:hypothetical protein